MAEERKCLIRVYADGKGGINFEYNDDAFAEILEDDIRAVDGTAATAALMLLTAGAANAAADLVEDGTLDIAGALDIYMESIGNVFNERFPEICIDCGVIRRTPEEQGSCSDSYS